MSLSRGKSLQLYLNSRFANAYLNNPSRRSRISWDLNEPIIVPEGHEAHVSLVTAEILCNWTPATGIIIDRTTPPIIFQVYCLQYSTVYGATPSNVIQPTLFLDAEIVDLIFTPSATSSTGLNILYGTYTPTQLAAIINGKTASLTASFASQPNVTFTVNLTCSIVNDVFTIGFTTPSTTIQQNPTFVANTRVFNYRLAVYFQSPLLGFCIEQNTSEFWNGAPVQTITAESKPFSQAEKYLLVKSNLKTYNSFVGSNTGTYLAKIPVAVATGFYVHYQNSTLYSHPVSDRSISSLEVSLHQEDGDEVDLQFADWSCTIQIDFYKL